MAAFITSSTVVTTAHPIAPVLVSRTAARTKACICSAIALLPSRWWPPASRLVLALWPGFRNA